MWVKVYAARNGLEAHLVRDTLVARGFPARLFGEMRPSLAGELPIPEAMVEVHVPEGRAVEARATLARLAMEQARDPWACPCGEENPGEFDLCWSCGRDRPA